MQVKKPLFLRNMQSKHYNLSQNSNTTLFNVSFCCKSGLRPEWLLWAFKLCLRPAGCCLTLAGSGTDASVWREGPNYFWRIGLAFQVC
jgi:hypothetical protein